MHDDDVNEHGVDDDIYEERDDEGYDDEDNSDHHDDDVFLFCRPTPSRLSLMWWRRKRTKSACPSSRWTSWSWTLCHLRPVMSLLRHRIVHPQ